LTLTGWDPNYRDGYVQNWNLSIQRELMKNLVLETAYIGSKGTSLFYAVNVNQPYPVGGLLGSGSQQSAGCIRRSPISRANKTAAIRTSMRFR